MKSKSLLYLLLFVVSFSSSIFAQSGANDITFNPLDQGFGSSDGPNNTVLSTAIQSDGKLLIGGSFTTYNGTSRGHIARLSVDGTLDTLFNSFVGADNEVYKTVIQSDGKIIIAGSFNSYNGILCGKIARLNTDGSLDTTFASGIGANNTIRSIAIQSDGKLIIGGDFTSYNGTAINRIARLNVNGTMDATFNSGTGTNYSIYTIAIQSDGKIIIGGNFSSYNGVTRNGITRIYSNGDIDNTFNIGTGGNNVYTISIQSDGKIIVGGNFYYFNSQPKPAIVRLNTNGAFDTSWNSNIMGYAAAIYSTAIQSDGKIVIGGMLGPPNYDKCVSRLNVNGTNDITFSVEEYVAISDVKTITIETNGKIIIGGSFNVCGGGSKRNYLARLSSVGVLDMNYNISVGSNGYINVTAIQSDDKIIIGGAFTSYNGKLIRNLARLNSDGSLDTTFQIGTGLISGSILDIKIQSDGKIILAGGFYRFNGIDAYNIIRLNPDGSIDNTFIPGIEPNPNAIYLINSVAIQSDGKIIVGGDFHLINGVTRMHLARLNSDGSLDLSFSPGNGADYDVTATAVQNEGKMIIGGRFTQYAHFPCKNVARINMGGSYDNSFISPLDPGSGNVNSIAIQNDGKIIIGGGLFLDNYGVNYIARLNPNGSRDTSFKIGIGANATVYSIVLQEDGKILIAGEFTTINGVAMNHIARLNINGTIDTTFHVGNGTNSFIKSISIQSDKKIIIAGDFTSYNGAGRNRIARIMNDYLSFDLNPTDASVCVGDSTSFNTVSNGIGLNYQWQVSTDGGATFTNISSAGSNPTYIGFMSDTLKLINANLSNNGNIYRCQLSNNSLPSYISNPVKLFVSSAVASQPSVITGSNIQCVGTNGSAFSVVNVLGNTYNWTVPADWNIIGGQGTNNILVTVGTASGNVSVVPVNGCGSGPIQTLAITTKPAPAQPDTIIGSPTICEGVHNILYRVDSVAYADSYIWLVPNNWTITAGQGNDSLFVTSTSSGGGSLRVFAKNTCESSSQEILLITRTTNIPFAPTINGISFICSSMDTLTYSVYNRVGESYNWSVPIGWTLISGQGTYEIKVLPGSSSGEIGVTASNACGNSNLATRYLQIDSLPLTPDIITGQESVCQGQNSVIYSIDPEYLNATAFVWTLPLGANGTSGSNIISVNFDTNAISGDITVKGLNVCGAGSASTLGVTVNESAVSLNSIAICNSELPYSWNGLTFVSGGSQTATLVSSIGCDSLATLNLIVNQNPTRTISETTCNSYTAPDGVVYTTSGIKTAIIPNPTGCDSVIMINLTINTVDNSVSQNLNTLNANASPATYQWLDCNNNFVPISGAIFQSYTPTADGYFAAIVTQESCTDTSACVQVNIVGIASETKKSINLYPNPVFNELIIEMPENTDLHYLEILNGIGQVVYKGQFEDRIIIQTSHFTPGVYVVKLGNQKTVEYKMILKD